MNQVCVFVLCARARFCVTLFNVDQKILAAGPTALMFRREELSEYTPLWHWPLICTAIGNELISIKYSLDTNCIIIGDLALQK